MFNTLFFFLNKKFRFVDQNLESSNGNLVGDHTSILFFNQAVVYFLLLCFHYLSIIACLHMLFLFNIFRQRNTR